MSRPDEEADSIRRAGVLLWALTDPQKTPRVPTAIRKAAKEALRHYPGPTRTALLFQEAEKGKSR